jgi:drug/metabolite transporter (DMT)-like permease
MQTKNTTRDYVAYLFLLGIGIIWGGQFLFNAQAIHYFPPVTIAASRVLIGALTVTFAACFISEKPNRPHQYSWSIGLLFVVLALTEIVLPLFLIVWGQQHVESSVTAVIVGSVPIITLIFSVFLSKKSHFSFSSGLSVALGFIGIVVLVKPSAGGVSLGSLIYEIAIFAGAVSFAVSIILFEKIPQDRPIRSVRNILWIASIPLIITALVLDKPWTLKWGFNGGLSLMVLGVVASGIVYVMYAVLIQRSGPVFTSLSNFIVPLVGVLLGVVVRGEHFGTKEWFALALIVGALVVNELSLFSKPNSINVKEK